MTCKQPKLLLSLQILKSEVCVLLVQYRICALIPRFPCSACLITCVGLKVKIVDKKADRESWGTRTRVYDVLGGRDICIYWCRSCIVFSDECMHVYGAEGWWSSHHCLVHNTPWLMRSGQSLSNVCASLSQTWDLCQVEISYCIVHMLNYSIVMYTLCIT